MISEEEYQRIKTYLSEGLGIKIHDSRIRSIKVNPMQRWQPKLHIQVGNFYNDLNINRNPEQALAIFESMSFCVCTPENGGGKGQPYFFTRQEVLEVEREKN
ncbi:hypothetical protein K9N50_12515 [bacterium]|nr:hypothetical protein [bacterium]